MSVPAGEKAFYEAAGIGRLTREHDGWESRYGSSYIYEEGTFDMEGYVTSEELPALLALISAAPQRALSAMSSAVL